MSSEDDMIENGFNNEQDYLEYLHYKAENEWDKQLERDKKADEWDKCLDSLTEEDIYELKIEKQEKAKRLSAERMRQGQQENQLKIWKENNPEEKIIWNSVWNHMCHTSAYLMYNIHNNEYDEWKKWLEDRQNFKKWKDNNKEWCKTLWDFREMDMVINWVDIGIEPYSYFDPESICRHWNDFSLWKETHMEEWLFHQENCTISPRNDNIYDLYAWGQILNIYSDNDSDVIFELWRNDNLNDWEKWKGEKKLDFLRNTLYDGPFINIMDFHYRNLKTWTEKNSEIWEKWKTEKSSLLHIWEKEFLTFCQELKDKGPKELYKKGHRYLDRDSNSISTSKYSTEEQLEWGVSIEEFWVKFLYENKNLFSSRNRLEERKIVNYEWDKRDGKLEKVDLEIEREIRVRENNTLLLWSKFTSETNSLNLISNLCDKKLALLWIKENKLEYDTWLDSYLWKEKKQPIEAYEKWIENLKNKGELNIILFDLWKEKNKEQWEKWEKDNFDELKSKINDLLSWKMWIEKNNCIWKIWADDNLDTWKNRIDENWQNELYISWSEDHFGGIENYNKWLIEVEDTWNIWENELIDRFYKRNYYE